MFSCIICTCIRNFLLLFLSQFLPPPKLSPLFLKLFVIACWASCTDYLKFLILLPILLILSLWLCFLRHSRFYLPILLLKCFLRIWFFSFFNCSFFSLTVPFCGILTFVHMHKYFISVATADVFLCSLYYQFLAPFSLLYIGLLSFVLELSSKAR